jgi:NB-ARC domain
MPEVSLVELLADLLIDLEPGQRFGRGGWHVSSSSVIGANVARLRACQNPTLMCPRLHEANRRVFAVTWPRDRSGESSMANSSRRPRPSYQGDAQLFQRLLDQSGLSIVDYASEIQCGETTLRNLLAGVKVSGETLRSIAICLGEDVHWHSLLSPAERKRIGVDDANSVAPNHATQQKTNLAPTLPQPVSSRLFQLPAVLSDFAGREQHIAEISGGLRQTARSQSVLHGMGGIGKTSLSIKIAYEVQDCFPDGQLFIDLRGAADNARGNPLPPADAMACVIHAFHPEKIQLPGDEQELASQYRGVLAGKRVLIVLDNVRSESQARPLLTAPPPTAFLLTSRTKLALDGVNPVQVELLSRDESALLFHRIIGDRGSKADRHRIVELCGYLPLAIRVAGDFLRLKEDWPIARYIEALEQERLRWLKIGDDSTKDVEAVLKLSSVQLVQDSVERATRWHLLHIFQGGFSLGAAAAAWNADENDNQVLDDLSDMKNRSLIIFDPKTVHYHLHDLMRPIAKGLFE